MSLKFLHISDIHFNFPLCSKNLDPDRPFRTKLVSDVKARVREIGPLDAILVNGDLANAGKAEEFDAARTWLEELVQASQCNPRDILFVPGNHDVSRTSILSSGSVRNAQQAIIHADNSGKEQALRHQIFDDETGRSLLRPLQEYNKFVARYGCALFLPDRLYWSHDFQLGDGFKLRIHGLTSTLLCSAWQFSEKRDEEKGELYLSPLQTVLDPVPGVVNAVMCHHPPDWFLDGDEVEDVFRGRAMVQLFGHKHRQRVDKNESFIRFSAGAVNPNRQEVGWEPGYNIVEFEVSKQGDEHFLETKGHLYIWNTDYHRFDPKVHRDQNTVVAHKIRIQEEAVAITGDVLECRKLTFRFWKLSNSDRVEIINNLNLTDSSEIPKSECEKVTRALNSIFEANRAHELKLQIEAKEGS